MCGGVRHVSGWGLSCGASLRCVVGGHMDVDVDVDVDTRAAQHVCGVRAVGCMSVELGMWWWGRNMRTGVLNVPEAGWSKRAGG